MDLDLAPCGSLSCWMHPDLLTIQCCVSCISAPPANTLLESLCVPRNVNLICGFQISPQVLQLNFSAPRPSPGGWVWGSGCSLAPRHEHKGYGPCFLICLQVCPFMQRAHDWILLCLKMDLAKADSGSKNKVGNKVISTFFCCVSLKYLHQCSRWAEVSVLWFWGQGGFWALVHSISQCLTGC